MAGKIKVSRTGKLFFSHVVKNGRVQRAFREQIGIPVGRCVAGKIPRGSHPGRAVVLAAIRDCAPAKHSIRLNLGAGGPTSRMAGRRAAELGRFLGE